MVQEGGREAQGAFPTAKTIFLVEDDQGIGDFLVSAIEQETPYHALLLSDSFQALKAVQDIKPDLLILDYHLPRMNGLELYDHLQAQEGLTDVPTIMISANFSFPLGELTKRHITSLKKPFDLDAFLPLIERLLPAS
jgi:DNA-binding response OmpR family regulator